MDVETKALREEVFDKGHKRELDLNLWSLILDPMTCLRDNLLINQSINTYLWTTYWVRGSVPGFGCSPVNNRDRISVLMELSL